MAVLTRSATERMIFAFCPMWERRSWLNTLRDITRGAMPEPTNRRECRACAGTGSYHGFIAMFPCDHCLGSGFIEGDEDE